MSRLHDECRTCGEWGGHHARHCPEDDAWVSPDDMPIATTAQMATADEDDRCANCGRRRETFGTLCTRCLDDINRMGR